MTALQVTTGAEKTEVAIGLLATGDYPHAAFYAPTIEMCAENEDAAFQLALGEPGEEALDRIEPGAQGRREVKDEARVARQPSHDLVMRPARSKSVPARSRP